MKARCYFRGCSQLCANFVQQGNKKRDPHPINTSPDLESSNTERNWIIYNNILLFFRKDITQVKEVKYTTCASGGRKWQLTIFLQFRLLRYCVVTWLRVQRLFQDWSLAVAFNAQRQSVADSRLLTAAQIKSTRWFGSLPGQPSLPGATAPFPGSCSYPNKPAWYGGMGERCNLPTRVRKKLSHQINSGGNTVLISQKCTFCCQRIGFCNW